METDSKKLNYKVVGVVSCWVLSGVFACRVHPLFAFGVLLPHVKELYNMYKDCYRDYFEEEGVEIKQVATNSVVSQSIEPQQNAEMTLKQRNVKSSNKQLLGDTTTEENHNHTIVNKANK